MKTFSKSALIRYFVLGGIFGFVAGLIHFFSGTTTEFTSTIMGDTAINTFFGVLSLIAAWMLKKGNQAVFLIVILEIVVGVFYAFAIGRGLNIFVIIIGGFLLWQLYELRKRSELTNSATTANK